jgi:hypothetical protein
MAGMRRDFWGTAVGLDRSWAVRRIDIFKTPRGYNYIDEALNSRPSQVQSADSVAADVALMFGLRDVKLEMPHLGIYPRSKAPVGAGKMPARKAGRDAWGDVLKEGKLNR